jgi:deoxyribodipyrimidine photo-lyase
LHQPDIAPPEILRKTGIELGRDYPKPIVDHAAARQAALEAFKQIADPSAVKTQDIRRKF